MDNTTDEFGRRYHFAEKLDQAGDSKELDHGCNPVICDAGNANLLGSMRDDGMHCPVIDIDIPCRYVPSTTPGHGHLYIDHPMTWKSFKAIMRAMENAGVVQSGYRKYSEQRGQAFVRPQWVKKPKRT